MNRGDTREDIFVSTGSGFLETLGETCLKTGWGSGLCGQGIEDGAASPVLLLHAVL
jgi:hypothetical protein